MRKKPLFSVLIITSAIILLAACGVLDNLIGSDTPHNFVPLPPIDGEIIYQDADFTILRAPLGGHLDFVTQFSEGGVAEWISISAIDSSWNDRTHRTIAGSMTLANWDPSLIGPPGGFTVFEYERGFINKHGQPVNLPDFDDILVTGAWSEGLLSVVRGTGEHDGSARLGFVNEAGETVIPFDFLGIPGMMTHNMPQFINGIAAVQDSERSEDPNNPGVSGAIDRQGNIVVPFRYTATRVIEGGYVLANRWGGEGENLYDRTGRLVIDFGSMGIARGDILIEGGYVLFRDIRSVEWGAFDRNGNLVVPAIHNNPADVRRELGLPQRHRHMFSEYTITEREFPTEGDRGVFDPQGNLIIPDRYSSINFLNEVIVATMSIALSDNTLAFHTNIYDSNGNIVNSGEFVLRFHYIDGDNSVVMFSDWNNDWSSVLVGFIGPRGNIVVPFEYNEASMFINNLATVRREDQWYVLEIVWHAEAGFIPDGSNLASGGGEPAQTPPSGDMPPVASPTEPPSASPSEPTETPSVGVSFSLNTNGGISVLYEVGGNPNWVDIVRAAQIMRRRLDSMGIMESRIFHFDNANILVEFGMVADPQAVILHLGSRALLEFADMHGNVLLDSSHIARAEFAYQEGYIVALTFTDEGRELFTEATMNNIGRPINISLDGELITAPIVQAIIADGNAIIGGNLTEAVARRLADTIMIGAMPHPLTLVIESIFDTRLYDASQTFVSGTIIYFDMGQSVTTEMLLEIVGIITQTTGEVPISITKHQGALASFINVEMASFTLNKHGLMVQALESRFSNMTFLSSAEARRFH